MRNTKILLPLVFICFACYRYKPAPRDFNFEYIQYHHIISTFDSIYVPRYYNTQKKVYRLVLTNIEKDKIYNMMVKIDLFSFPEKVSEPDTSSTSIFLPHIDSLKVLANRKVYKFYWGSLVLPQAQELYKLENNIKRLIMEKKEFRNLPLPR